MDQLGTDHAWSGAAPAEADAAPLVQGEYNRMARYESMLSAEAVGRARAGIDRSTNRGERHYLAILAALAGEGGDDNGPTMPGVPRMHVIPAGGDYVPHAVPGFNQR